MRSGLREEVVGDYHDTDRFKNELKQFPRYFLRLQPANSSLSMK